MTFISIVVKDEESQARVVKKLQQRTLKSFLDVIVMRQIISGGPIGGYDLLIYIKKKYGFLASSGTVYSLLYSMERNGLIKGMWKDRIREYQLTEKGTQTFAIIEQSKHMLTPLLKEIFGGE